MKNLKFNQNELLNRQQLKNILGGDGEYSSTLDGNTSNDSMKCCYTGTDNCSTCSGGWICPEGQEAKLC